MNLRDCNLSKRTRASRPRTRVQWILDRSRDGRSGRQRKSRFLSDADPRGDHKGRRSGVNGSDCKSSQRRRSSAQVRAARNNKFLTSDLDTLLRGAYTGVLRRPVSLLSWSLSPLLLRKRNGSLANTEEESHSSQSTGANGNQAPLSLSLGFLHVLLLPLSCSFSLSFVLPFTCMSSSSSHRPIRKGSRFLSGAWRVPRGGRPLQVLRTNRVRIETVN